MFQAAATIVSVNPEDQSEQQQQEEEAGKHPEERHPQPSALLLEDPNSLSVTTEPVDVDMKTGDMIASGHPKSPSSDASHVDSTMTTSRRVVELISASDNVSPVSPASASQNQLGTQQPVMTISVESDYVEQQDNEGKQLEAPHPHNQFLEHSDDSVVTTPDPLDHNTRASEMAISDHGAPFSDVSHVDSVVLSTPCSAEQFSVSDYVLPESPASIPQQQPEVQQSEADAPESERWSSSVGSELQAEPIVPSGTPEYAPESSASSNEYFELIANISKTMDVPSPDYASDVGHSPPSESSSDASQTDSAMLSPPRSTQLISMSDYIVPSSPASFHNEQIPLEHHLTAESDDDEESIPNMQTAGCDPSEETPLRQSTSFVGAASQSSMSLNNNTSRDEVGTQASSSRHSRSNSNQRIAADASSASLTRPANPFRRARRRGSLLIEDDGVREESLTLTRNAELTSDPTPPVHTFRRTSRRGSLLEDGDAVQYEGPYMRNAESPTDPTPPVHNFRRAQRCTSTLSAGGAAHNEPLARNVEVATAATPPAYNFWHTQRRGSPFTGGDANFEVEANRFPTSRVAKDPPADLRVVSVVALDAATKLKHYHRRRDEDDDNDKKCDEDYILQWETGEKATLGAASVTLSKTDSMESAYAGYDSNAMNYPTPIVYPFTNVAIPILSDAQGDKEHDSVKGDKGKHLANDDLQIPGRSQSLSEPFFFNSSDETDVKHQAKVDLEKTVEPTKQGQERVVISKDIKNEDDAGSLKPFGGIRRSESTEVQVTFERKQLQRLLQEANKTIMNAQIDHTGSVNVKSSPSVGPTSIHIESLQNDHDAIVDLKPVEGSDWKETLWNETEAVAHLALNPRKSELASGTAEQSIGYIDFGATKIRLPDNAPNKALQLTKPSEANALSVTKEAGLNKARQTAVLENPKPRPVLVQRQETSTISLGSFGSSVESLESFSGTHTFQRGSLSTISTEDSASIKRRHEQSEPAETETVSKQLERGGNIFGLIQSQLEHVFFDELDAGSGDDGEDYKKWIERSKGPRKVWDSKGRVWTKPGAKLGEEVEPGPPFNPEAADEKFQTYVETEVYVDTTRLTEGSSLHKDDPNRMRIGVHQHEWSETDSESQESGDSVKHFLGSLSRIRKELHTLALRAEEHSDSNSEEASTEIYQFLRDAGIRDDMIDVVDEQVDRTAWRKKMTADIGQALLELDFDGLDLSDDESEESSDEDDPRDLEAFAKSLFMLTKAKRLFTRAIKSKFSNVEQDKDDISFLTISSSEGEEEEPDREADTRVIVEIRPPEEVDVEAEEKEDESLGSLGEHCTNFKKVEAEYMFLENYASFRLSSTVKKVEFADDPDSVFKGNVDTEVEKRTIFGRLASILRFSKGLATELPSELNKLINDDDDDVETFRKRMGQEDHGDDDDEDSHYADWLEALPEERWDDTDRHDFYEALQVHWEPAPVEFDDTENPYVGFDETGGEGLMVQFLDQDDESSGREFSVPISMLDKLYKKIPKQRHPLFLFVFFLLVVVFPVSCGLSVAASRAFAEPPTRPPVTESPSSAPTSGFTFKKWTQIGDPLVGSDLRDQMGFALSLSDDGSVLAIGARKNSCPGSANCGSAEVYQYAVIDGVPTWFLVDTLKGDIDGNQFGFSVSLSGNGKRLAVGSIGDDVNGKNSGMVQVFQQFQGIWKIIAELRGEEVGDLFGVSVSLNGDGRMLVVGAPYHAALGRVQSGRVYSFEDIGFDGSPRWIQSRNILSGPSVGGRFGWSLSLSEDASRVVVGAPADPSIEVSGFARVFQFDGFSDKWVQNGVDLGFRGKGDRFGYYVSICNSGSRMAIGAYKSKSGNETMGGVFAYQLENEVWTSLGQSLVGDSDGADFGYAVNLSPEGDYLAVGAINHEALLVIRNTMTLNGTIDTGNATDAISASTSANASLVSTGMTRVFSYEGDSWVQSEDIIGTIENGNFGAAVDLSSEAARVAVGIPRANEAIVFE
jgi:hypothetical protein